MIKKIKYLLLLSLLALLALCTKSQARITTTDPSCNSGGTVNIVINSQEKVASGAISVTDAGGLTFVSATGGQANGMLVAFAGTEDKTSNLVTYTFTAPQVTETKTFTVKFASQDMADADGNVVASSSANATVTVKGTGATTNNTPTTTTEVKTPTFTDVNKTMYASGDINLRESWSTSSKATGIDKGTELNVTGTSKDKVNGYVWYRVKYNGTTKYVASYLLTNTKPVVTTTEDDDDTSTEKSNNKKLKSLSVTSGTLTPEFDPNIAEYTMLVENDIETVEVVAEAEEEKAKVEVSGNKDLKVGENTITIKVTAEDKTVKTYKIVVTRENKGKVKLKELLIEGATLKPQFKSSTYEYEINIENEDIKELNITATATDEEAEVEIVGNTNLKLGENVITIMVTSSDGKEISTYQIKANISAPKPVATTSDNSDMYKYIVIGVGLALVILVAIAMLSKHRKNDDPDDYMFDRNSKRNYNNQDSEKSEKNYANTDELPKLNEEDLPKYLRTDNIDSGNVSMEEKSERRKKIDEFYDNSEMFNGRKGGKHF